MVVESLDAKGKVAAFGSGIVIASGNVITNRHVIEDGVSFRVGHNDKKWPAKLVRVDPDHDLAELSVAGLDAPAVTVLDSSNLAVGETVYAIGAPEGLELTISEGLISGLREHNGETVIQTTAPISEGSSGGGQVDGEGYAMSEVSTFRLYLLRATYLLLLVGLGLTVWPDIVHHKLSTPLMDGVVSSILGTVAVLSALYPARRAATVDPIQALRFEAGG